MDAVNDTTSLSHINTIMPLISLMSAHFLVNSFTLVSDLESYPGAMFMKVASNHYLKTSPWKSVEKSNLSRDRGEGYIIYHKLDFDILKVVEKKPKLVVLIHRTDEETPFSLEFLTKLVIPPSVSFFVVLLPQDARKSETPPKCFRFYKSSSGMYPKIFPTMRYRGRDKPEWVWESNRTNWNSFERETRNMSEVTIKIALSSYKGGREAAEKFWMGKNSFFWIKMREHLKFRVVDFEKSFEKCLRNGEIHVARQNRFSEIAFRRVLINTQDLAIIHFEKIPLSKIKNVASIYVNLLRTVADGLGVLPVITPERFQAVEFILTGLDTKNHIMIRAPYYIHSWQSIFKPFASDSWLCLGIAVLLTTVCLQIVTSCRNSHSSDFSGSFLITVGIICGQGCPNIPKGLPARAVCYTCIFFSILIYQFYTSNFYSLLSTKEVTLPFTSLEEFVARKTHSMYIHPDTAVYADIKKAKGGILKKLWDDILSKDPSHLLKTDTRIKAFERVCSGKGSIFGLPHQTIFSHELKCRLVTINSGYFPANIVTAVRKNFPFKPQFQFVHLRLLEAGLSHKYRDEEMRAGRQQVVKTETTSDPVSLEHVAFLFVFHIACVILTWVLLGLEVIVSKALRRGKGSLKGGVNKMVEKKMKVRWSILENVT